MAALTNSRNTPEMADFARFRVVPVEAATTIYLGSMVAINAAGNAVPASSNPTLKVIGRAERVHDGMVAQDAVNIVNGPIPGAGAAGAISIIVKRGVFLYADNDASILQANVGDLAYAVDDNSVSAGVTVAPAAVAIGATPAGTVISLAGRPIAKNSVVVQNAAVSPTTVYEEGRDYLVDYRDGGIVLPVGTTIPASANVYIGYRHGDGRPVAGTIAAIDQSGDIWVDFWHRAPLAV